jgi:hypothetical protein
MAYDTACLDGMLEVHATMFPRSSNMTPRDVESMFSPFTRRPLARKVYIPIAQDMLVRDEHGVDLERDAFIERVRAGGACAELIVEFTGFKVDATTFTPVAVVSEAALCSKPAPKRKPRITAKIIPVL